MVEVKAVPFATLFDDSIWRTAIRKPLYSSVGFSNAAIPGEVSFFGYARGALVPGAGNAAGVVSKVAHTNMELAGSLPLPKKFRCNGISVHMLPAAFGSSDVPSASDPTSNTATQDSDLIEDLLLLTYSTVLTVKVGNKEYADHPLDLFPSNTGFAGLCTVANDNASGTNVGTMDVVLPHTIGNGISYRVYPFLIENGQSFSATLRCFFASPPSLNDARLVTVVLHGSMYREVQ